MTDSSKQTEHVHQTDFSSKNQNKKSKNGNHDSSNPSSTDNANSSDTWHQHPPAHQDFHWIDSIQQGSPYANFLETTLDISAGIHACPQIAYASDLERAANRDADPGETAAPAVGIVESDQLVRMAIATSGLLRDEARRRVEVLND